MIPARAASKVLLNAAQRLGGVEQLAAHLGLTPAVLRRQIDGTHPVGEVEYLKAVDVVLGEPAATIARDRTSAGGAGGSEFR